MKFSILSGVLFAIGLLSLTSYHVQELIAALVLFSVGFGGLFVIAVVSVLVQSGARGAAGWVRTRMPQWYRGWAGHGFPHSSSAAPIMKR